MTKLYPFYTPSVMDQQLKRVRLMNYYPSHNGWEYMWINWDQATMDHDFGSIAGMGANTVRLILQPKAFGPPVPVSLR